MDRKLEQISPDLLKKVRLNWESIAGKDEFSTELGLIFDQAEEELRNDEPKFYVLMSGNEPQALLDLYTTKQGAMAKLLKIHTSPKYWGCKQESLIELYSAGILETIKQGASIVKTDAYDVKIYGRDDDLHQILTTIESLWGMLNKDPMSTARMEGRWLRLSFA